jgi:hypothetical protein
MYVAAPGIALACAASVWAALVHLGRRREASRNSGERGRSANAWGIAATVALAAILAFQANAMIARRLVMRVPGIDLPLDPALRSMVVAGRAVMTMGQYLTNETVRIAVLTPALQGRVFGARSGQQVGTGTAGYDLHRAVLNDGGAVRVFYPQIQDVRFVERWSRDLEGFDLFMRRGDAVFTGFGRGPEALIKVAHQLVAEGQVAAAAELMDSVSVAYPHEESVHRVLADIASMAKRGASGAR